MQVILLENYINFMYFYMEMVSPNLVKIDK
jgi:hypothetical protein